MDRHTNRLILKEMEEKYAPDLERLINDYDVAKMTRGVPHPYPEGGGLEFIRTQLENQKNGKRRFLAITLAETGEFIGEISLMLSDKISKGTIGYWIGKPYWQNGYMSEAAEKMIEVGFMELDLYHIDICALHNNPASWKIAEKLGFKFEGQLRNQDMIDGEWCDLKFYGMTKAEYLEQRK